MSVYQGEYIHQLCALFGRQKPLKRIVFASHSFDQRAVDTGRSNIYRPSPRYSICS